MEGLEAADSVLVVLETNEGEQFLLELVFFGVDWVDFAEGRAERYREGLGIKENITEN